MSEDRVGVAVTVAGAERGLRRGRLTSFVKRHTRAWETVSGVAALGFLGAAFSNDQNPGPLTTALVVGFTLLFVLEFAARLSRSWLPSGW